MHLSLSTQMMERNPEIGQMLNNPALLRQMMETMRNPVGTGDLIWCAHFSGKPLISHFSGKLLISHFSGKLLIDRKDRLGDERG